MLYAQHRFAAAAAQFGEVWRIWNAALGPEHVNTRTALNGYGASLFETGDAERAEPLLQQAYEMSQRLDPPRNRGSARNTYALLLGRRGRLADAEKILRAGLAEDIAAYGGDETRMPFTRTLLGRVLRERGDIGGARDQFEHALVGYDTDNFPDGARTATCLYQLALVLQAQHEPAAKIRPLLERALPVQESNLGGDDPETVATRRLLAALRR
jgi:tetratricopeptide (TPR) repeat protein